MIPEGVDSLRSAPKRIWAGSASAVWFSAWNVKSTERSRTMNAYLDLGGHNKTASPRTEIVAIKQRQDSIHDGAASRLLHAYQQNSMMSAWLKPPHVGKIEILSDQETTAALSASPNIRIGMAHQTLINDGIDVMPQG